MSDVFMRNVLNKPECTEYILQVILDKKDLRIEDVVVQKDFKNLQGRSAILDCVALDQEGIQYNIEIQQEKEGASEKRARYHSGLLDMNTLNAGEKFEKLPESYVIFLTQGDILGEQQPICHIERTVKETGKEFPDKAHIIYVNTEICEDTELGRMLHDLHCSEPDEMYSEILAQRVKDLKKTWRGVENMCREMDELIEEICSEERILARQEGKEEGQKIGEKLGKKLGKKQGKKLGKKEAKREIALAMIERGMSIADISEIVKVSGERIQKWVKTKPHPVG